MLSLLGDRRFLRIWFVGAVSNTIRWLEMLAVGVYVFDVTGSPFQVALFTLLRMLPLGLFGVFGGALSDRGRRDVIMTVGLASMCCISL
ncbi:MAG: MFS transporter, partial [Gammaproteobacteria bacterium]|nr:MFS transporter [Gammaproteobacteria bacterium]